MYDNDCKYIESSDEDEVVVPESVTWTDPTCEVKGTYTIPDVEGVIYYVDGVETDPGTYDVVKDGDIDFTAEAAKGYVFENGTDDDWEHDFITPDDEECELGVQSVTPAAVVFTPATCSVLGYYTIPTTEGVKYYVDSKVVTAGKHEVANGTAVTVTAAAASAEYELKDGAKNQWTYTFTAPTNCTGGGSVLGDSTTLPNTSAESTGIVAIVASMIAALSTAAGAFMRKLFAR